MMIETFMRLDSYIIPAKGKRKGKKVYNFHCNICDRNCHICRNAAAHIKSGQEKVNNLKKVQFCNVLNTFCQVDLQKDDLYFQYIFPKYRSKERIK